MSTQIKQAKVKQPANSTNNYILELPNGQQIIISAYKAVYTANQNLAIELRDKTGKVGCLTKNFDNLLPPDQAFIDVVNHPEAEEYLMNNRIGFNTMVYREENLFKYPLYYIYTDRLNH